MADLHEPRWLLIRDALVFQVKLVIDAARDGAMIPVSLAAATLDLLAGSRPGSGLFYRTVLLGRRSEAWIDLFEAADRIEPRGRKSEEHSVDELFRRVEGVLVEQRARGGLTASAQERIDRLLDAMTRSPRDGGG